MTFLLLRLLLLVTPMHVRMQDLLGNTSTDLSFEQMQSDVDIPDTLCDPQQLERVADSPLWQGYAYISTGGLQCGPSSLSGNGR